MLLRSKQLNFSNPLENYPIFFKFQNDSNKKSITMLKCSKDFSQTTQIFCKTTNCSCQKKIK